MVLHALHNVKGYRPHSKIDVLLRQQKRIAALQLVKLFCECFHSHFTLSNLNRRTLLNKLFEFLNDR